MNTEVGPLVVWPSRNRAQRQEKQRPAHPSLSVLVIVGRLCVYQGKGTRSHGWDTAHICCRAPRPCSYHIPTPVPSCHPLQQAVSILPVLTLLLSGLPSLRRGQRQARRSEAPAAAEAVWTGPGAGEPGQLERETPDSWGLGAWPGWGAGRQLSDEGAVESAGVRKQGHTRASGIPGDHCGEKTGRIMVSASRPQPPAPALGSLLPC